MSSVQIVHRHNKSEEEVRSLLQEVEESLRTRYGVSTRWREDAVSFKRSGLSGELRMEPQCVVINLKLGVMLAMHSRKIQTELERVVADKLA